MSRANFNPTALERCYPEIRTTGFSRVDGTVEFYNRVNALLMPDFTVLDFGAGRGVGSEDPAPYRRALRNLRTKVREVVGVDVDPAVYANPTLDRALVMDIGAPIPWANESVDMIISDFTFEHITDPAAIVAEFDRVLKPGGWLCARTPNKWGYIGFGARLIPNRLHVALLARVQPERREEDVFPTVYRLNSFGEIKTFFQRDKWLDHSYAHTSEPTYVGQWLPAWWLMLLLFRLTPMCLGAMLHIFLQKRE